MSGDSSAADRAGPVGQARGRSEPRFTRIEVEPRAGVVGEVATLSWSTEGADVVEVEGYGLREPDGELEVAFEVTGRIKLIARSSGGVIHGHTDVLRAFRCPEIRFVEVPVAPSLGLSRPGLHSAFAVADVLSGAERRTPHALPATPGMSSVPRPRSGGPWEKPDRAYNWGRLGPLLTSLPSPKFPGALSWQFRGAVPRRSLRARAMRLRARVWRSDRQS